MPDPLFSRCSRSSCHESALLFSDHCWEHVHHEGYSELLKAHLDELYSSPRPVNLKKAQLHAIDFSGIDLKNSSLSQAHLTNCSFIGSDLRDADMIGARFHDCDFVGSEMEGSNLTRAVLIGCSLSHADLRQSRLAEIHLRDVDCMGAILFDCILWNSDLSGAKHIKKSNFCEPGKDRKKAVFRLNEKSTYTAYESYRSIKHYFYRSGLYEDASWAAYRELTMERKHFFEKRDWRFFPSLMMDLLSGYTEIPNRVIVSSMAIIAFFGVLYYLLNVPVAAINAISSDGKHISLWDSLYFSFVTFTTVGYGDFVPRAVHGFRALVCIEAFSGPFMSGLYIFTLTRRYAAN